MHFHTRTDTNEQTHDGWVAWHTHVHHEGDQWLLQSNQCLPGVWLWQWAIRKQDTLPPLHFKQPLVRWACGTVSGWTALLHLLPVSRRGSVRNTLWLETALLCEVTLQRSVLSLLLLAALCWPAPPSKWWHYAVDTGGYLDNSFHCSARWVAKKCFCWRYYRSSCFGHLIEKSSSWNVQPISLAQT